MSERTMTDTRQASPESRDALSGGVEAGRELDARVAAEVMGWMPEKCASVVERPLVRRTGSAAWTPLPRFSTWIDAAWLVVEKMRETHWATVEGIGRPDPVWRAKFERMSDVVTGQSWPPSVQIASTAPLAICRAALLATAAADPEVCSFEATRPHHEGED